MRNIIRLAGCLVAYSGGYPFSISGDIHIAALYARLVIVSLYD